MQSESSKAADRIKRDLPDDPFNALADAGRDGGIDGPRLRAAIGWHEQFTGRKPKPRRKEVNADGTKNLL